MPAIYHWKHTVTADEIDEQGHVSNVEYVRWMQSAAMNHSAEQGWPPERYVEEGSAWVVRTHFVEYLAPAFEGDEVEVVTWVANFRKVLSLRRYRIIRPSDGIVLAKAETDWAYLGRKHHVPRRIPKELIGDFVLLAENDEPA